MNESQQKFYVWLVLKGIVLNILGTKLAKATPEARIIAIKAFPTRLK